MKPFHAIDLLPWVAALLTLALAACTQAPAFTPTAPQETAAVGPAGGEAIDLFVRCREAERRRDPDMGLQVLHFAEASDRDAYLRDLYFLAGRPGGTVVAPQEVHAVAGPPGGGPGDYVLLEPGPGGHRPTLVTVVGTGSAARLLYRRPDLTEQELARLPPESVTQAAAQRRAAWWRGLRGPSLTKEVERLRFQLRGQERARQVADSEGVRMVPLSPEPQVLLASLEGLSASEVRNRAVGWLSAADAAVSTPAVRQEAPPAERAASRLALPASSPTVQTGTPRLLPSPPPPPPPPPPR